MGGIFTKFGNLVSILTFLIFTFALFEVTMQFSDKNTLNLAILGIMLAIVFFFILCFFTKAGKLKKDLQKATKIVEEGNFSVQKNLFSVKELKEAFKNYQEEMERLKTDSDFFVTCDIADYITISGINQSVHKSLCESVPGALTGLGILGTFLGLIVGLRDFNLGSDYETMQTSITLLINGIKTAFLTSIYGVVYSILFNFIYRMTYQNTISALNQFYDAFYRYAVPNSQNEMSRNLVKAQEIQIKNQNQALEKIVQHYATGFNTICGEQLKMLKETLCEINTSEKETLQIMKNTINSIYDREAEITKNTEQLSRFSETMENYMKNVFDYQMQITKSHQALLHEVNQSTAASSKILDSASKMSDSLSGFTTQMTTQITEMIQQVKIIHSDYQNTLSVFTDEVKQNLTAFVQQSADLHRTYETTTETIQKTSEDAALMINEMTVLQETQKDHLQNLYQNTIEVTREFQNSVETVQNSASELVNNYQTLSERLSEDVFKAFDKFDETASNVGNEFYETLEQLQDVSEQFPKSMEASLENLKKIADKIQTVQIQLSEDLKKKADSDLKSNSIGETAEDVAEALEKEFSDF